MSEGSVAVIRTSVSITVCTVVVPLILGWVRATTDLSGGLYGLFLAMWILGCGVLITVCCMSHLEKRIDRTDALIIKKINDLQGEVESLRKTMARELRSEAINAALDDNITSINKRR